LLLFSPASPLLFARARSPVAAPLDEDVAARLGNLAVAAVGDRVGFEVGRVTVHAHPPVKLRALGLGKVGPAAALEHARGIDERDALGKEGPLFVEKVPPDGPGQEHLASAGDAHVAGGAADFAAAVVAHAVGPERVVFVGDEHVAGEADAVLTEQLRSAVGPQARGSLVQAHVADERALLRPSIFIARRLRQRVRRHDLDLLRGGGVRACGGLPLLLRPRRPNGQRQHERQRRHEHQRARSFDDGAGSIHGSVRRVACFARLRSTNVADALQRQRVRHGMAYVIKARAVRIVVITRPERSERPDRREGPLAGHTLVGEVLPGRKYLGRQYALRNTQPKL
jgi:hypothetical protein